MQITILEYIAIMFVVVIGSGLLLLMFAKKRQMKDRFNLTFKKNKVIKVNFITATGITQERYLIPDERGIVNIDKGSYFINRDLCGRNGKYRIPEITLLETQPHSALPELLVQRIKEKVLKIDTEGNAVETMEEVPTYFLSYRRMTPKKLEGLTAQEIRNALDSKIVRDIVNATNPQMQKLEMMFFIMIGVGIVTLIGFIVMYTQLSGAKELMQYLISSHTTNVGAPP